MNRACIWGLLVALDFLRFVWVLLLVVDLLEDIFSESFGWGDSVWHHIWLNANSCRLICCVGHPGCIRNWIYGLPILRFRSPFPFLLAYSAGLPCLLVIFWCDILLLDNGENLRIVRCRLTMQLRGCFCIHKHRKILRSIKVSITRHSITRPNFRRVNSAKII